MAKRKTDTLTDTSIKMQQVVTRNDTFSISDVNDYDDNTNVKSLGVYLLHENATMPVKASDKASCYDLYSGFNEGDSIKQYGQDNKEIPTKVTKKGFSLYPRSRALIPTGIKLDIPKGYDVRLYSRSGISFKDGIALINSVGIIDNDYRGEVFVAVINNTDVIYTVKSGIRIAQMEVNKVEENIYINKLETYDSESTLRKDGGFGSTGKE